MKSHRTLTSQKLPFAGTVLLGSVIPFFKATLGKPIMERANLDTGSGS